MLLPWEFGPLRRDPKRPALQSLVVETRPKLLLLLLLGLRLIDLSRFSLSSGFCVEFISIVGGLESGNGEVGTELEWGSLSKNWEEKKLRIQ